MDSIRVAKQQRVRVSVVGLAAEVRICRVMTEQVMPEGCRRAAMPPGIPAFQPCSALHCSSLLSFVWFVPELPASSGGTRGASLSPALSDWQPPPAVPPSTTLLPQPFPLSPTAPAALRASRAVPWAAAVPWQRMRPTPTMKLTLALPLPPRP